MSATILAALERAEPIANGPQPRVRSDLPASLAPEAFHGIAGEVVQLIDPQTEADPAAVLVQFLAAIGNLIGHGPHYRVEASEHHPKLNVLIVGDTSKSRKGTSWDRCLEPLRAVDPAWAGERIVRGLSSGEGLIHAVRDPLRRSERDRKSGDAETIVVEPGVEDKRLLVQEPEFASVLRVVGRQGNTLSPVIRDAWDQGALSTLTRNTPLRATRSHISIIGHITAEELASQLNATEVANGLMNRFLIVFARRSKMLPFGGAPIDWSDIVERLRIVRAKMATVQEVRMSETARRDWVDAYPLLSSGKPGLLGAATGRAEAQAIRLALIYALLDGMSVIDRPHLSAALAVWDYADASAAFVLGDSLGDPVADAIMAALASAGDDGLTQLALLDGFKRHLPAKRLNQALHKLEANGQIFREQVETGGRPATRWRLRK